MEKEYKVASIKKVVTILSVLWPITCATMLLSIHYSTRSLIVFFCVLAAVPVMVAWVLVFVSRYLEERTNPRRARSGSKSGGNAKKRA
jgi:hypothetical protein